MLFIDFAKYLKRLEETPKRLEITEILKELITKLDKDEITIGIYLSLGYLKAPFQSLKFNIADKLMIRILETTFSSTQNKDISTQIATIYSETGDLGDVAEKLKSSKSKVIENDLSLTEVYTQLTKIAELEGHGSQDTKIILTSDLLKKLEPLSAKYCVRIILGTTRLGFTELTILDALSGYVDGSKKFRQEIERIYSTHPDIGLIAKQIKKRGMSGIEDIKIETGVPVLSQKAQRLDGGMDEVVNKMGEIWAEYKFDGTRVQLHLDRNKPDLDIDGTRKPMISLSEDFMVKTFTRNLEETTHQYPDIIKAARECIKADSVILDGEAIGYNKETGNFLAFQETIQRKRKYNIEEMVKNIPLKYLVFDILYLNGESMLNYTLKERKERLKEVISKGDIIEMDEYRIVTSPEEVHAYFEEAVEKNLEGLIAKKPGDPYQAGARSFSWVKLKKADEKLLDDSIDCTILGYYFGKGDRSKFGIGGFLASIYDEKTDSFKTITKVGTGLKDEDFIKLKEIADKVKIAEPQKNMIIDKAYTPDVYLKPSIVVEIGADEISVSPTHSAGYALRFPRLLKFRQDKKPTESTTTKEISAMFKKQKIHKSTAD